MEAFKCWDIVHFSMFSKCKIWRRLCHGGLPVPSACASLLLARRMPCAYPHGSKALTLQHLLLQDGLLNWYRDMEQLNHISLGPGFQRLSVADLEPQQLAEDPHELRVMEGIRQAIATLSQVTSEVKVYLSRTYSAVCSIADQNKEQNLEFKYVHSRLSCVESRLDDIERNTIEILGKMDSIREDLSVFISKTQFSQVQEAPSVNQGMMEVASFLQKNNR